MIDPAAAIAAYLVCDVKFPPRNGASSDDNMFSRAGTSSSHHLNSAPDFLYISSDVHPSLVTEYIFGEYMGEVDHQEPKYDRYLPMSAEIQNRSHCSHDAILRAETPNTC